MPRNGSGTFSFAGSTWVPGVNGVTATTADWNALQADIAAGLTQSISKDGQTPFTGNLPMGNNKITGLAIATLATDAATFAQTAGRLIGVQVLTGSGNYTETTGTTATLSFMTAGGGAGGGAPATAGTTVALGGGGTAGATSIHYATSGFSGAAYSCGAGGTGVSGGTGNTGVDTTFLGCVVESGSGGAPGGASTPPFTAAAGGIGIASTGANVINGRQHAGVAGIASTTSIVCSGRGGNSMWGGGGANVTGSANGNPGAAPGAGGSGAANGPSLGAKTGGAGADGNIIVFEFS